MKKYEEYLHGKKEWSAGEERVGRYDAAVCLAFLKHRKGELG